MNPTVEKTTQHEHPACGERASVQAQHTTTWNTDRSKFSFTLGNTLLTFRENIAQEKPLSDDPSSLAKSQTKTQGRCFGENIA